MWTIDLLFLLTWVVIPLVTFWVASPQRSLRPNASGSRGVSLWTFVMLLFTGSAPTPPLGDELD